MQPRWIFLAGSGVCVYAGAVYSTLLLLKGRQCSAEPTSGQCTCTHDRCRFDALAPIYDSSIGWDEFLMGMPLIRWSQVAKARGQVLEVSAGTGRNFGCYSGEVDHVVFSDISFDMLRQAKLKWETSQHNYTASFMLSDIESLVGSKDEEQAGPQATVAAAGSTSFLRRLMGLRSSRYASRGTNGPAAPSSSVSDQQQTPQQASAVTERVVIDSEEALRSAVLAPKVGHCFEGRMFDSVVDTFGLCSCEDPVQALRQMLKVLRPGGRVILLEHGRSSWSFINNLLDSDAQRHFASWGCWWNRDMLAVLAEAGLEVEAVSRWHFGTTYCIVAKPSWRSHGDGGPAAAAAVPQHGDSPSDASGKDGQAR